MGKKPSFKLSASIKMEDIPNLDNSYHYKQINRADIVPNKKNDKYSQNDLEMLKDSILTIGLIHPLNVIYVSEDNNYRLISGERRYRSIMLMSEEEYKKAFPSGIPAMVTNDSEINDIDEEIALIAANSLARESSSDIKMWEYKRLFELYGLKKENNEITNIKQTLAAQLNTSVKTLQRVQNVLDTEEEVQELYDTKKISLENASKLVQVSPLGQKIAVEIIKTSGSIDDEKIDVLKSSYPQSRAEINARKKKPNDTVKTDKDNSIDEESVKEIAKKITSLSPTAELKKMNALIDQIEKRKSMYDEKELHNQIKEIIDRLKKL